MRISPRCLRLGQSKKH
jgi:hypothetical protein